MKRWHLIVLYLVSVSALIVWGQMASPPPPKVVFRSAKPVECVVKLQYPRETHVWKGYVQVK